MKPRRDSEKRQHTKQTGGTRSTDGGSTPRSGVPEAEYRAFGMYVMHQSAMHEAGRAVAAVALRLQVDGVALMRLDERLDFVARCAVTPPKGDSAVGSVICSSERSSVVPTPWALIALHLSGGVVDYIHRWGTEVHLGQALADFDGGNHAIGEATRVALAAYGTRQRAERALLAAWERIITWITIPEHWACVVTVAAHLLARDLDRDDIHEIAQRYGIVAGDRRLLPSGRPFVHAGTP